MKQVANQHDVKRLGTILAVWAHPDDETFCAAGLLAAAVRNGQTVVCITATRGEAGSQDIKKWPASKMGGVRTKELGQALKILGIVNHHWLDYKDGRCAEADPTMASSKVANYINQYQPDTIITFGPEGLTGHPDHQAVSQWVDEAAEQAASRATVLHSVLTVDQYENFLKTVDAKLNFFYNIDQPPLVPDADCAICFNCTDELCNCKQDAFASMPSQYTKMRQAFAPEYLSEAFRVEAFIKADE